MKSVVVEASTVAKAIELAWQKAEKPEEFFIRILQEHHAGFLGFGAQKAKIVFFFKNKQKTDALFPVVLKQQEYINLFKNDKLKVPSQINVIDHELNKNISLGQKKKPYPSHKQNHQARQATQEPKTQYNQIPQQKNTQPNAQLQTTKTQIKIELPNKPVIKQEQTVKKNIKDIKIQKTPMSQAPKIEKPKEQVKTQITTTKSMTNAVIPQPTSPLAPTFDKSYSEHSKAMTDKTTDKQTSTPRVIQKLKRRPLTGADQGVSGITRSSREKTLVVATTPTNKSDK